MVYGFYINKIMGIFIQYEYDANGNEIYYENSDGEIEDYR